MRGTIQGVPYDIQNVYQKVRIGGTEEAIQRNLAERATVCKQLEKCVLGLPYRDVLLLAGDLNTALPKTAGLTGNSVDGAQSGNAYMTEAVEKADLLARAGLVACNTFGKRCSTFMHSAVMCLRDVERLMPRHGGHARPKHRWQDGGNSHKWRLTLPHDKVIFEARKVAREQSRIEEEEEATTTGQVPAAAATVVSTYS